MNYRLDFSEDDDKGRFRLLDGEKEIGEITYRKRRLAWIADHTFVAEDYRGQGLAYKLYSALRDKAQDEGMKIKPVCPYVKKTMEKEGIL